MMINNVLTYNWQRLAGGLLLLFTGLSLSGCQVAHMALPQSLQSESSELPVAGRSLLIFADSFDFTPYRVSAIQRGWTQGKGWSISSGATEWGHSQATQKYEFSVNQAGHARWDVQCASGADWSQLDTEGLFGGNFAIEFSSNRYLLCSLKQAGGETLSKLIMAQSASANETVLHGVMTDGSTRIEVSATHRLETTSLLMSTPTGYVFHSEGRPVGAVEVINKGTVWLSNALTPDIRSALAATSAVLLLYQDIKKMAR